MHEFIISFNKEDNSAEVILSAEDNTSHLFLISLPIEFTEKVVIKFDENLATVEHTPRKD